MKINSQMCSVGFFIVAVTFCIYRVSQRGLIAQAPSDLPQQTYHIYVAPDGEERKISVALAAENVKRQRDREHNYKAKANNGSKRRGMRLEELPEETRVEAARLAREYREVIYPALKGYVTQYGSLPWFIPEKLRSLMKEQHPLWKTFWAIGEKYRMDGTLISRDLYSKDPPDAPHDIWARNSKFVSDYDNPERQFIVTGWDDGHVTFDLEDQMYFYTLKENPNQIKTATPGAAGIFPDAVRGWTAWLKKDAEQRKQGNHQEQSKPASIEKEHQHQQPKREQKMTCCN